MKSGIFTDLFVVASNIYTKIRVRGEIKYAD